MPRQGVAVQPPTTPGGPTTVTVMPSGVPTTRQELFALREKRGEISNQLVSAQNRRKELAEQLATADPGARSGIQARMRVLDDRLVRLEQELDRTGELIMNVPPQVLSQSQVAPRVMDKIAENIIPVTGIVGSLFLLPLALAFARLLWKRASAPAPAIDNLAHQRLEQLQQAVDTIAIEVERISEGQRYVTRTLNERGLGAGAAEPVAKQPAVRSELR